MKHMSKDYSNDPYKNSLLLLETLPYIKRFRNKKMVIKLGGAVLQDENLLKDLAQDIVMLQFVGIQVIVVHGGGPQINQMLKDLNINSSFVEGRRVTDKASIKVIDMVLSGYLNKKIVSFINQEGGKAVGISGQDGLLALAETFTLNSNDKAEGISLGYVGKTTGESIDTHILYALLEKSYIPVISPTAPNSDGEILNVNADVMAGAISVALQAEKFILLSDTNGVQKNEERLPQLTIKEIHKLIDDKVIKDGMLPKIQSCIYAIENGVKKVHIINGTNPHTLLLEIFTDAGIGTMINGNSPKINSK